MKKQTVLCLSAAAMILLSSCGSSGADIDLNGGEPPIPPAAQRPPASQSEERDDPPQTSASLSIVITSSETSASDDEGGEPELSGEPSEALPITVRCVTLNAYYAEFELTNNGDTDLGYGYAPYFQKLVNGSWLNVKPVVETAFPDIFMSLPANGGTNTFSIPIHERYGQLHTGKYRAGVKLCGDTVDQMIWYEFSVDVVVD